MTDGSDAALTLVGCKLGERTRIEGKIPLVDGDWDAGGAVPNSPGRGTLSCVRLEEREKPSLDASRSVGVRTMPPLPPP